MERGGDWYGLEADMAGAGAGPVFLDLEGVGGAVVLTVEIGGALVPTLASSGFKASSSRR